MLLSAFGGDSFAVDKSKRILDRYTLVGIISEDSSDGKRKGIVVIRDKTLPNKILTLFNGDRLPKEKDFKIESVSSKEVVLNDGIETVKLKFDGSAVEGSSDNNAREAVVVNPEYWHYPSEEYSNSDEGSGLEYLYKRLGESGESSYGSEIEYAHGINDEKLEEARKELEFIRRSISKGGDFSSHHRRARKTIEYGDEVAENSSPSGCSDNYDDCEEFDLEGKKPVDIERFKEKIGYSFDGSGEISNYSNVDNYNEGIGIEAGEDY